MTIKSLNIFNIITLQWIKKVITILSKIGSGVNRLYVFYYRVANDKIGYLFFIYRVAEQNLFPEEAALLEKIEVNAQP